MRHPAWLVAVLLFAAGGVRPAVAAEPPRATPADPARARAEGGQRALRWLEAHVGAVPDAQGSPRKPFTLAITGLDLLLAAGDTTDGTGLARVRACVEGLSTYLDEVERRTKDASELPDRHGLADSRKLCQYTWPLGAALLCFAECQARGVLRGETKALIARAAAVLVAAQDENGGFGHGRIAGATSAKPKDAPPRFALPALGGLGYPSTLTSSTNVVAAGLGFARPWLGKDLDPALTRLRTHYDRVVLPSGVVPYDVSQRSPGVEPTEVGRTAGAVAAMLSLGIPATDDRVKRASAFADGHLDDLAEGHGSPALNVFLGALAARMRGGDVAKAFDARILPRILAAQDADGAFDCICHATALGVTCDAPTGGMHASGIAALELGQRAYVTALHLFAVLFDRPERLRVLRPAGGKGVAPVPAPATTPSERPRGG